MQVRLPKSARFGQFRSFATSTNCVKLIYMERMDISVLEVRRVDAIVVAKASAIAPGARIVMEVEFVPRGQDEISLLEQARDEVLRYLDVA